MALALTGIFLSLIILITLAYRGHSVIAVAPIAASVAIIFSGAPLLASYTQVFMPALAGFIAAFFPLFLTGAIFGKLMTISGYAQDLANWISRRLGPNQAILVTVLATAMLTYGGVSAWVVVFTIFPVAKSLFEAADIPKRLMPAAIALGIFTFATAALPGSPQIHNSIPTRYFGTNTFAAPILGLIGAAVVFGLGMLWLNWRKAQLARAGESFADLTMAEKGQFHPHSVSPVGTVEVAELDRDAHDPKGARTLVRVQAKPQVDSALKGLIGMLPILIVVAINAIFTYLIIPSANFDYLASERFGATTIQTVAGIWSVTVAMIAAIAAIFLLRVGSSKKYVEGLTEGAKNAILPVFTTASEVGYGAVIASLAAFALIRDGIFGVSDNAVAVSVLSTSVISGVTGSAAGGLTITLATFGEQLKTMAADQGISMELMHRVTAMASTGFDSLPHNGAIVTLLLVSGLSHREAYKDIGVVTVLVPVVGVVVVAVLGLLFGAF